MARFRVAFDGEWQEDFDTLADAVEWAKDVSTTGRTTWVVERRLLFSRFRVAFPMERTREARELWHRWSWPSGGGGG
jgi:hypothetical protein